MMAYNGSAFLFVGSENAIKYRDGFLLPSSRDWAAARSSVGAIRGVGIFQEIAAIPSSPTTNAASPESGVLRLCAELLLLVDTAVTATREVATPLPALFVMLASKPVLGIVTVAGAFVIVAVIAVPLELMVMMVWLALSVWMAMSVVSVPVPTTVDRPAVSEIVAEPRVMVLPTAISS